MLLSVASLVLPAASALTVLPAATRVNMRARPVMRTELPFDPLGLHTDDQQYNLDTAPLVLGLAALAAAQPEAALAKGGEYGIFEGRIVSLAHPVVMGSMYAASAWAAFTGLQWRRLREIGGEIS